MAQNSSLLRVVGLHSTADQIWWGKMDEVIYTRSGKPVNAVLSARLTGGGSDMTGIIERIVRAGAARMIVKAAKSAPVIGTAVAIGLIGYEVKKKGLVKGLINTALDATPILGATKNAIEMVTGDWLPDKSTDKSPAPGDPNRAKTHAPSSNLPAESLSLESPTDSEVNADAEVPVTPIRTNRRR
jgi:hypothetical protein